MTKLSGTMSDVLIPPFDQQLYDNYRSTDYTCHNFRLQPGRKNAEFVDFLRVNHWYTFAFVTAYNPYSLAVSSRQKNLNLQQKLLVDITNRSLTYLPAMAQDQHGKWPVEPGFFIFNAPLEGALQLAATQQQHAILWGTQTEKPVVLWTHGTLVNQPPGAEQTA